MVAGSTETKQSKLPVVGIVGVIVMLAIFSLIRVLWQQGGRPFATVPGADFIAAVVLIVVLVAAYYIHKRTKQ